MKLTSLVVLVAISGLAISRLASGGVIKDLFNKLTHTNNKTEDIVKQSAPICGSSLFSTPDEHTLSPEFIFITSTQSKSFDPNENREGQDEYNRESSRRRGQGAKVVLKEFRFHEGNVTLEELRSRGFNPNAPTTFLMHGFTSGYPLQPWISAITEAYAIDRKSSLSNDQGHGYDSNRRPNNNARPVRGESRHNLFIVNWHYAARGIVYPRAVANIPIVASYLTRFINNKMLDEAGVDPRRIQMIGHSLGAHLAGFVGKNAKSKLGRIYGLDPAGPCFGSVAGFLYPSSKRLAPSDALEVITIQTNSALLGIGKPLGRYSVYVEGGTVQPGCKAGGVLSSLEALTFEGENFDTVGCSHRRAPNLLTYRYDQSETDEDCQLVAYECKDWDSFLNGHCGVCSSNSYTGNGRDDTPERPVECIRIGLDWQYPGKDASGDQRPQDEWQRPSTSGYSESRTTTKRPYEGFDNDRYTSTRLPSTIHNLNNNREDEYQNSNSNNSSNNYYDHRQTSTRRPSTGYQREDEYNNNGNQGNSSNSGFGYSSTRRPTSDYNNYQTSSYNNNNRPTNYPREKKAASNSSEQEPFEGRREEDESVKAKKMFLKTSDTQPYCVFHYQVILELNEPFEKKPGLSLLLQDSEPEDRSRRPSSSRGSENSLSCDSFGNKFNDYTYTQLLTSGSKLHKIDHGTLLVSDHLKNGYRTLKSLRINYMSSGDPNVRKRLSSRLCVVKTDTDRNDQQSIKEIGGSRFYFEECDNGPPSSATSTAGYGSSFDSSSDRRPTYDGTSSRRPTYGGSSNQNNQK